MPITLTPEPCIVSGSYIPIVVAKSNDIESYIVTTDGTPPVLAKYIAYDNLVPQNPFIATVEDGLGKILLDGGFPKWYNDNYNNSWTTYSQLSASFKYLYDAIDFISNKTKVNAGNKKILIIGDSEQTEHYSIKDDGSGNGGFKKTIDRICSMKGYTPTYKTKGEYANNQLDIQFQELDNYCCILFFSTAYTNVKFITDTCIQSLVTYRQSGNGIFFISDHGDRDIPNITYARTQDYYGFYRTANYVVTNFGCYFSGNYDRNPVNVGFLRTNYGNHPLWANLSDSEYIQAGGSESRIFITTYPLNYGSINLALTQNGYIPVQFLLSYSDGTIGLVSYTYGLNVPEIIFPKDENENIFSNTSIQTVKDTFFINFKIDYSTNCSGLLKLNTTVIGSFTYTKSTDTTEIIIKPEYAVPLYQSLAHNINVKNNNQIYLQMISPISYTKTLNIDFPTIDFNSLRFNKFINSGYIREFLNSGYSSSSLRNKKHAIMNKEYKWWLKYPNLRFKASVFKEYFERNGNGNYIPLNSAISPNANGTNGIQAIYKTFDFGLGAQNIEIRLYFDFIEIMSWDGEYFNVYVNDSIVSQKRYWVDSYYASESDGAGTINNSSANLAWPDEIHKFSLLTTTTSQGIYKLGFGSTLNEPLENESYAIDNIKLLARFISENFEANSNGWNIGTWDSVGYSKHLGLMGGTSGLEAYYKTYNFGTSNANRKVVINLDFYKIDSWDNEYFTIFINGMIIYKRQFVGTSVQNDDGTPVSPNGDSPTWEFEEVYHISFEANTDDNGDLRLGFGSTLDQPTWDEAFSIDNIWIDLVFTETFEYGSNGWNLNTTPYLIS